MIPSKKIQLTHLYKTFESTKIALHEKVKKYSQYIVFLGFIASQ